MRLARVIGIIGRCLVLAGIVLLFYTAYLLWGTNVYTRNEQKKLEGRLQANPIVTNVQTGAIPAARPPSQPKLGDPLFKIVIPKIGLRTVVVEGVGKEELKKGPGRFPDCAAVPSGSDCVAGSPWPGEDGNVALSGHRTTFGAPFFRTNELQPGDTIFLESGPARYRYTVTEQKIVAPSEIAVIQNHGRNELTLTSCHPRFSAAQRLIVHARYDGPELIQVAAPQSTPGKQTVGGREELVPAPPPAIPRESLILSLVALLSVLGAAALSNRYRLHALWAAFVVCCGVGLWTAVFPQVLRLMPANY